jgi:hypothetical protein
MIYTDTYTLFRALSVAREKLDFVTLMNRAFRRQMQVRPAQSAKWACCRPGWQAAREACSEAGEGRRGAVNGLKYAISAPEYRKLSIFATENIEKNPYFATENIEKNPYFATEIYGGA